ncbi:hypothetical protein Syun_011223 [Stephania yunnanensis]|uniref:Uncharacterized protein n=1 Tax=Stephania yunnanensis TaxID=152371 RepID=A0AAP0JX48_9MAGN
MGILMAPNKSYVVRCTHFHLYWNTLRSMGMRISSYNRSSNCLRSTEMEGYKVHETAYECDID